MKDIRPNVVLVITDDHGYGDLGCTGHPVVKTPHIDEFYSQSVRLTQFHVGPTCAPTRAGLLTGHYANSTGVWHTIGGRSLLRENEWTLASALSEAGYATGIFGKWHLGDAFPYRPHDRGFATAVVHGGGGISQTPDYWGNDYFDDTYFVNGRPQPFRGYCTDVWFDLARRWITEHRHAPFFCYIPTNAPHSPYNVDRRYYEAYLGSEPELRARFHGMITNIDENFGRLRAHLRDLGLEENTILVFMTDNGTSAGVTLDAQGHVVDGYNAGMRGMKAWEYEGGHRVPFFVRWPARGIQGGRDVNPIAANVDFMPTILDLCGVEVPRERSFHGRSLAPLLDAAAGGGPAPDWPDRALVTDSQRVTNPIKWRKSSVMTDRWRLVNGTELYDITADPGQRNDIAPAQPQVVERLRREYEAWWEAVSVQFESMVPILIGTLGKTETLLTCHDLRNADCDVPWHQGMIRQGQLSTGHWEIRVEKKGTYTFELRRWPRELDHPVDAGIDFEDISWNRDGVPEQAWSMYQGGKALAVTAARVRVGAIEKSAPVERGARSVVLSLDLEPGETTIEASFSGEGFEVGSYYVYVAW